MSNWRLCVLPLLLGGPDILDSESRRLGNILVAPPRGKAAIDSRRLRPNRVGGTLAIVTTECLRPPGWGAGAWERVDRKAASLGDGPDPSPPRSLSRLTCRHKRQDCFDTRELSYWRSSLAEVKLIDFIFGQSRNFTISSSKYTIDSKKTSNSLEFNATLIFPLL